MMRQFLNVPAMLICIAFFLPGAVHSQGPRYYQIEPVGHKVIGNSLYHSITLLDMRADKQLIGIIDPGKTPADSAQKFLFRDSVQQQLGALLDALTDNTAGGGELLFQLRRFHFIERFGSRFCYLSAILYAKTGDRYLRLSLLDTTFVLTGSVRDLNGDANKTLTNFLAGALLLNGSGEGAAYSRQDIENLDNLTKQRFPLYTNTQYADGIYNNSTSFLNQTPDWQGYVDTQKDGTITGLYTVNSKGNRMHEKHSAFAVVYHGVPYIETVYGFYPLEKVDGNIYVTADVRIPLRDGQKAVQRIAIGVIPSALVSEGIRCRYRLVFDPVARKFLHQQLLQSADERFR
ncbi:MAG TPA: hypothetical protein VNW04_20020 [Puia sp.]|nr:hypothetical protein [Puia sp.]